MIAGGNSRVRSTVNPIEHEAPTGCAEPPIAAGCVGTALDAS